ncbi:hypothetical protein [Spirosoma montaniterrae]|uniref:DUF5615 domain-containing protein n=1 Tax=Spirosoma montaniterrae TaxID=1178516 RepID=A0A1P9WZ38_9BACT|nr:hypothetical protein [Spirosoma montaniterrae]AQG80588.1 hypothetical protein AWR27_15425 [Spirosoma montaniterrae]
MNVLLDEQIDVRMKLALQEFSACTVQDKGWLGVKNGVLRERLNQEGFRFFITADKNIPFQQNLTLTNFTIILLDTPTLLWPHQQQFIPKLTTLLTLPPETLVKIVHISVEGLSRGKKIASLKILLEPEQILFL